MKLQRVIGSPTGLAFSVLGETNGRIINPPLFPCLAMLDVVLRRLLAVGSPQLDDDLAHLRLNVQMMSRHVETPKKDNYPKPIKQKTTIAFS